MVGKNTALKQVWKCGSVEVALLNLLNYEKSIPLLSHFHTSTLSVWRFSLK
jgi:hypothetical protein